jgi:hypothetical protein
MWVRMILDEARASPENDNARDCALQLACWRLPLAA